MGKTLCLTIGLKHCSTEEDPRRGKLSEHQVRGWRAFSATRSHGKGSHNIICSQTPVSTDYDVACGIV